MFTKPIRAKTNIVPYPQSKKWLRNNIPDTWKAKFFHGGEWDNDQYEQIYYRLLNICPRPTAEAINRVIGNSTWTENICCNCGEDVEELTAYKYQGTQEIVMQQCKECAKLCNEEIKPQKSILQQYIELRKKIGWNKTEAAHEIKISQQLMSYFENGERYPSEEIESKMLLKIKDHSSENCAQKIEH